MIPIDTTIAERAAVVDQLVADALDAVIAIPPKIMD